MGLYEIIFIGISLSMDAFAISMYKGLSMRRFNYQNAAIIAFFFGFFQFLMPIMGWALGMQFEKYITAFDHWIAFVLLVFIGGKMLFDTFHEKDEQTENEDEKLDYKELLVLAIATSIDALAVGITLAFLNVGILYASSVIGIVTFLISFLGVLTGKKFGTRFQKKAGILGGTVLIIVGTKILLEHLGYINF